MILLDTNVISELMKPAPDPAVARWVESVSAQTLYLSTITAGELWSGLFNMADGKRKASQEAVITELLEEDFADLVLPFDIQAARAFGEIYQARRRLNGKKQELDCLIAAIAKVNNLKLATRDVQDFEGCGLEIINPWTHR